MELIRKQVRMNQMGKTVTDQFMIGGDYNVPDAKSDVGRVLSGEGSLRIEETRRVENYLRVTGKLNFKVLYVTDSGDPRPGALEGMIPFEEMVYMEEENGEGEDIVQVQRVECGVSLIHSRKLAVKALAEMTVHTEQITEKQVTLDVDGEEGIYLKKCPVELLQLFTAKRDIYRIKEEIKIPGTKENIGTLLWTEVSSRKMDTRLVQDAMLINGELQIFVLYESQEGKTDWVEQTVPYEGRIECAGAEEGMYHHVYDRLDDISVEVRMDEDGEMRALGIEAALQVRLFVYGEEKLEILEDAYSLDKKCVLETEEVVVEELRMLTHAKRQFTERVSLPELNDEFAGEVSEFETMDEYKSDIRAKLAETKQQQASTENENNVVEKVVENAAMEIPDAMIDEQVREMINDYARRMQSQGISLEQYMQFTGMPIEKLLEQSRPQAEKRIRTRLVLEAVVAAENIQVSDEAVDAEIAKMAETYKMEADKVRSIMGEAGIAQMKEDMAVQEAVDFLVAEANLV